MRYPTCQAIGCERAGDFRVRAGAQWLDLCDVHRWEYVNPGCETPELKGDGDGTDEDASGDQRTGDSAAGQRAPAVPAVQNVAACADGDGEAGV